MFFSWIFGWREKTYHYVTICQYIQKNIGFLELAVKIASVIFPRFHLFFKRFFWLRERTCCRYVPILYYVRKIPKFGEGGKSRFLKFSGFSFFSSLDSMICFPDFWLAGKKSCHYVAILYTLRKFLDMWSRQKKMPALIFPDFLFLYGIVGGGKKILAL